MEVSQKSQEPKVHGLLFLVFVAASFQAYCDGRVLLNGVDWPPGRLPVSSREVYDVTAIPSSTDALPLAADEPRASKWRSTLERTLESRLASRLEPSWASTVQVGSTLEPTVESTVSSVAGTSGDQVCMNFTFAVSVQVTLEHLGPAFKPEDNQQLWKMSITNVCPSRRVTAMTVSAPVHTIDSVLIMPRLVNFTKAGVSSDLVQCDVVPIVESDGSTYVIKEGGSLVQYFTVTGSKHPGDFTVTYASFGGD